MFLGVAQQSPCIPHSRKKTPILDMKSEIPSNFLFPSFGEVAEQVSPSNYQTGETENITQSK